MVPLSHESAHPPRVHRWPVACVSRLAQNSADFGLYQRALNEYALELIRSKVSGEICAEVTHRIGSYRALSVSRRSRSNLSSSAPGSSPSGRSSRLLPFVVSYHPILYAARLERVISGVFARYRPLMALGEYEVATKVAWSVGASPSLAGLFRRAIMVGRMG